MPLFYFAQSDERALSRYRALGVQEVWFWEDGLFTLYNLGAEGYDRINRSELVPELDFDLLTRCVLMNSIGDAAFEFERAIAQN